MNVALMVFNRPHLTARIFDVLCQVRPERLLVVADGPRNSVEAEMCKATRAIADRVDWPCEVSRNYSDVNLGCRKRVSSGLDWVFSQVEEAIIIEDDCLPHPSFFPYCTELLARYRNDARVMHISGDNFLGRFRYSTCSYHFSKYPDIWGWASWRRAWRHYDVDMVAWPAFRDKGRLREICPDPDEQAYWTPMFNAAHAGQIDSWDYGWTFACWARSGLAVLPERNLVSNIGFGPQSTHTVDEDSWQANLRVWPMAFPMRHPAEVTVCERADRMTFRREFLHDPGLIRNYVERLRNRYFWGAQIRRLPFIGRTWARWRRGRVPIMGQKSG